MDLLGENSESLDLESWLRLLLYLHQFLTSFVPQLPQESSDIVLNNLFTEHQLKQNASGRKGGLKAAKIVEIQEM